MDPVSWQSISWQPVSWQPESWQIVFGQAGRDALLVLPEIMLALFALAILWTDCFLPVRQKSWHIVTALLGLAFSGASLWVIAGVSPRGVPAFGGSIVIDPFFVFFGMLCLAATALLILFSAKEMQSMESPGETCALILFAAVGMLFLACGNGLVVLFVALEILAAVFAVLLISAPARDGRRRPVEGAVKPFLAAAFGSAILAYGFSLLYGIAGSANLGAIAEKIAASPGSAPEAYAALALVCAGLLMHLAVPPFHRWALDSSEAGLAPVAVHAAIGAKIAIFAALLRFFFTVFWPMRAALADILAVVAVLSIAVGTLAALTQSSLKRLLACSAIAQAGYVLLALVGAMNGDGSLDERGMQAVAYCLFVYAFFGTGAFALVMLLGRGGEGDDLDQLEGFAHRSPARALLLLIFLLSFAGLPPAAGFVGVVLVISALVATQHAFLAFAAAIFLLPATYCSLRVIRLMWKPSSAPAPAPVNSNADAMLPVAAGLSWTGWTSWAERCALAAAAAVALGVGIFPERLLHFARYSILSILSR